MRLDNAHVHLFIEGDTFPEVTLTDHRIIVKCPGDVAVTLEGSYDAVYNWFASHLVAIAEADHARTASSVHPMSDPYRKATVA